MNTEVILHYIRIGYVAVLLLLDLIVGGVLAYDYVRFTSGGLSFSLVDDFWSLYGWGALPVPLLAKWVAFVLLALPSLVALARLLLGSGVYPASWLGRKGTLISALHLACAALMAVAIAALAAMEAISGVAGSDTVFDSSFLRLARIITGNTYAFILTFVVALGPALIVSVLVNRRNVFERARDLAAHIRLADLNPRLYPIHGRHVLNFNAGSVSPAIGHIHRRVATERRRYERCIPASPGSQEYLSTQADECRSQIRRLFVLPQGGIQFYPSTSRALAAIATSNRAGAAFVLSPYEHPTEEAVINEVIFGGCSHAVFMSKHPGLLPALFEESRELQVVALCEGVMAALAQHPDRRPILIVSEVCWSNGLLVPVTDVVSALKAKVPSLAVIVDGAHSPGNIDSLNAAEVADAYVFSAHKWLLAPDPLGVLVIPTWSALTIPSTFDTWGINAGGEIPRSTASVNGLLSFRTSLALLEEIGLGKLRRRVHELKARLLDSVRDTMHVVGSRSGLEMTAMMALQPRSTYEWKSRTPDALRAHLASNGISALVIDDYDRTNPWVRVTLPYFADGHDIDRLAAVIKRAVQRQRFDSE